MAGRPTKLTPDLREEMCKVLATGNTRTAACAYVGIHYSTFLDWLDRGSPDSDRDPDGIYTAFSEAISKAEAKAEVRNVAIIQRAAEDTWQAAAWWLERRRSNDYRRRTEHIETSSKADVVKVIIGGDE